MTLLIDVLSFLAVVGMFVLTWVHYPYLPERVPIHFGFTGRPDNWGPRWSIWLLPLVGLVLSGTMWGVGIVAPGGPLNVWLGVLRLEMLALFLSITLDQLRVAVGAREKIGPAVWLLLLAVIATSFFVPRG